MPVTRGGAALRRPVELTCWFLAVREEFPSDHPKVQAEVGKGAREIPKGAASRGGPGMTRVKLLGPHALSAYII